MISSRCNNRQEFCDNMISYGSISFSFMVICITLFSITFTMFTLVACYVEFFYLFHLFLVLYESGYSMSQFIYRTIFIVLFSTGLNLLFPFHSVLV